MLKTVWTLMRGAAAAAEEDLLDQNALLILDQQIRDAAAATERAKRALALAIAQDEAEGKRLEATLARIADLETRARAALAGRRDDLVGEATEAIATLEAERDCIREARANFARDIAQMKRTVADATRRLAELERGRRIAQTAEAVRRLRAGGPVDASEAAALAEAEVTLRRLRARQAEDAAAAAALQTLNGAAPADISQRMEAAGFGPRTRPTAADVLARLRDQVANAEQASPETHNDEEHQS
jgi:phage shock protein A